jgi:predicted nucleic acid-binding protein
MDAVLLDTDVFSFLIKEGDTRAELYRPHVKGKTIALSFVTVGELFAWSVKKNWNAKRRAELDRRIRAAVVVPYDLDLCRQFGRLKAELMIAGRTVPANDLWIAACALRHGLPLITHNRKDFEGIPNLRIVTEAERPKAPETGKLFKDAPDA